MPALLTSASIEWKRDSAVSTIWAAVAGSPMWPSTKATWSEASTSVDWVTLRELATTLKPRSTNAFTIPAPIPCEAPVTMAVFGGPLMFVYLENISFSLSLLIKRCTLHVEFASGHMITKPGHWPVDLILPDDVDSKSVLQPWRRPV